VTFVKSRGSRFGLLGLALLLLLLAAYSWLCFVAQGIAYGDLFGIRGRENDLAAMASRGTRCMQIALGSEALAIMGIAWFFSAEVKPLWQRLCFSLIIASVADVFTFALIRGL